MSTFVSGVSLFINTIQRYIYIYYKFGYNIHCINKMHYKLLLKNDEFAFYMKTLQKVKNAQL